MKQIMKQSAMSIFLIGFMGSGKSTVARILGEQLQRPVIDLDARIVSRSRCSIATIFRDQGESHFRELETEALRSLDPAQICIVATGGGIVGKEENWLLMRQRGITIYLNAEWKTLIPRLQGSDERPLANPEQGWEAVQQLFERRLPLYAKSDLTVNTDGLSPKQVADEIIQQLQASEGKTWTK